MNLVINSKMRFMGSWLLLVVFVVGCSNPSGGSGHSGDSGDPPAAFKFSATHSFIRVNESNVLPVELTVELTKAAEANTFVSIVSSNSSALAVTESGVTILQGETTGSVGLTGNLQAASVTLTATLNGETETTTVRVLDPTETPTLSSLTPTSLSLSSQQSVTFTVTLDIPAGSGGAAVALLLTPSSAGKINATMTVPADAVSATVDLNYYGKVDVTLQATLNQSLTATIHFK